MIALAVEEAIIGTQCGHHGCCEPSPRRQGEASPGIVFFGPAECLLMLILGMAIENFAPVGQAGVASGPSPRLLALLAYLCAFAAGGLPIFVHALADLWNRRISIDLLMVLAAVGAAVIGDWAEGAILLFLFSLSHALEHFILGRTRRAISDLMQLTPAEAMVVRNGLEMRLSIDQLVVGDTVLVMPSARIPADGTVTSGKTSVDQSPMTGESMPIDKQPGDPVFAGTLNQQGSIQFRVTRTSGETTLARMVELVERAQAERPVIQEFTDWFGQRYTWLVLIGSGIVLLIGYYGLGESMTRSFYRAITILVAASPCAIVISIPAPILSAIAGAARGGVLFKGGSHLVRTSQLQAMAFDKTGTLTLGRPQVADVIPIAGVSETELLLVGAALESQSEHPLAKAVVECASERGVSYQKAESVQSIIGGGVTGVLTDKRLRAGKLSWFREQAIPVDDRLVRQAEDLQAAGKTVIWIGREQDLLGLISVVDRIRPTAAAAMDDLRKLNVSPLVMLSGDHPVVAERIAREFQIDYQGGLMPEEKLRAVQLIREQHGQVGMIGDGTNDAPSLAGADVGFALGGAGTDVALETADVVVLADDLRRLPYAIALARKTRQIIHQNLIVAFGVMGLLLMLTTVWTLPLPLVVFGHEGSTVAVILNGLRLLAFARPKANESIHGCM